MKKTNLTLYTTIGDPKRIQAAIEKLFTGVVSSVSNEVDKTVLLLQDDSKITFYLSHIEGKDAFVGKHTEGMAQYFDQVEAADKKLKENVIRQIRLFNCVTGVVFETDDNDQRTNYILNTLFDVASEINGYLLYPNMSLYNGKGKLVFSIEGKSELAEFIPVVNTGVFDKGGVEESENDKKRYERSIGILKKENVPYIDKVKSAVTESEAEIRSREEMLQRAVSLFAVAVYSEVMLSENPDREEALFYFNKMDEIYGVHNWITPVESVYISKLEPEENERIQFVWRYENCAVLLWAAGVIEELPYPSDISDVPVIAEIFWQHKSMDELLSRGVPRSKEEILDAADLTFRYDWACVDARVNHKDAPASLDAGVVMERHYTFNWIIGANERADWDNIQPDT